VRPQQGTLWLWTRKSAAALEWGTTVCNPLWHCESEFCGHGPLSATAGASLLAGNVHASPFVWSPDATQRAGISNSPPRTTCLCHLPSSILQPLLAFRGMSVLGQLAFAKTCGASAHRHHTTNSHDALVRRLSPPASASSRPRKQKHVSRLRAMCFLWRMPSRSYVSSASSTQRHTGV
jgi:hypothetical protein